MRRWVLALLCSTAMLHCNGDKGTGDEKPDQPGPTEGPQAQLVEATAKLLAPLTEFPNNQLGKHLKMMEGFGEPAVDQLVHAYKMLRPKGKDYEARRFYIVAALHRMKSERAVPAFMAVLQTEDQRPLNLAVIALKDLGPKAKAAAPALLKLAVRTPCDGICDDAGKALHVILEKKGVYVGR